MVKIIQKKTQFVQSEQEKEAKKVISKLRHQSEEEQAATFAASIGLQYIDTNLFPISPESVASVSEDDARHHKLAVIQKSGRKVSIVTTDPTHGDFQFFINNLKQEKGWEIKVLIVSKTNLERIWEKYQKVVFADLVDQLKVQVSDTNIAEFEKELQDLKDLKERIGELSTTQIMSIIMAGAYKLGGSDVHFEPQSGSLRLRYRIDGVLHDVVELPLSIYKSLISRIKVISGMKINLRDISQDGTFEMTVGEKKVKVRVSAIPGNFGESIVMRLLDPDSISIGIESLGLQGLAAEEIQKRITAPNGMILTTGPTGSGKTTTLYAMINKLNDPETKIITIEDPIEYELPGISQTQVEKDRGYTFAQGLRAIVRQDPDVILVGEIRDDETADIAVNSALTGHLVLSTIHTNSAVGTIPRLIELGIKPSLISASVNAIIGQRLVRKLCDCKEEYEPAKESVESLKKVLSIISPKAKLNIPKKIEKLYRPKGCPKCNMLGYKGRVGIFEVLTINEEIEKLVLDMAGETDLTVAALESGMITMLQDGILKALNGITSIDEVKRVTGEGEFLEKVYDKLMSQTLSKGIFIEKDDYVKTEKAIFDFAEFQKIIASAKTNEINKLIFAGATILNVGDIHLEPGATDVSIRFRIDGILQTAATFPLNEYPNLLGEIKILSGIKTQVREGVVDSRFSILFDEDLTDLKEHSIDVRVSIILGGYGETVVMRLLNKSGVDLDIQKLGIRQQNLSKILHQVKKPNGVVLTTGPTGSGKTTTLYSLLKFINKPEIKIITVEDPIEYQMEGILQTPVNEKEGYTFATALRSLLRQNPDILMIGEIRDDETAKIAAESALTGHLVLSTLHTNNASGAVQRLLNMGVSSSDIASSTNCIIAQRLVRKLCDCKEKQEATPEQIETIQRVLKEISPASGVMVPEKIELFAPKGCSKCNQIGYKGRTTITEVLEMTKEIQELVTQQAITSEISDKAVVGGMLTMAQDGILKVLEGETTLEEIERVTEI